MEPGKCESVVRVGFFWFTGSEGCYSGLPTVGNMAVRVLPPPSPPCCYYVARSINSMIYMTSVDVKFQRLAMESEGWKSVLSLRIPPSPPD